MISLPSYVVLRLKSEMKLSKTVAARGLGRAYSWGLLLANGRLTGTLSPWVVVPGEQMPYA